MGNDAAALKVNDVVMHFPLASRLGGGRKRRFVHALDGVTLTVSAGETLGIVGESGSGKTTLGRIVSRLLTPTSGTVFVGTEEVTTAKGNELRTLRQKIQMVFQDPYASLNPRMTVREIVAEPVRNFRIGEPSKRSTLVDEALVRCGLDPSYGDRYPHQFSGGQRQRIGLARALVVKPQVLVADEPVSALDVSIQAQVMNLLRELSAEFHLTSLFISHDLSVVRYIADRVAVLYLGKVVELAPVEALYTTPIHPYTHMLLDSVPIPDPDAEQKRQPVAIHGEIPSPISPPSGCRFHTRCPIAQFPLCSTVEPQLTNIEGDRKAACHFADDIAANGLHIKSANNPTGSTRG